VIKYDESKLIKTVDLLPKLLRTAFAALCAERLLPAYLAFAERLEPEDRADVASILNRLWSDLEGDKISLQVVQENRDACLALLGPEDEGEWSDLRAYGEGALAAVAYALYTRLSGKSEEAVLSARCVYEALDYFVNNEDGIDASQLAEEDILAHPLIQQELARQWRDLDDLVKLAAQPKWHDALIALRTRAAADAYSVLQ
jgi:uncharacterized protein YjaG (DUF416 family)